MEDIVLGTPKGLLRIELLRHAAPIACQKFTAQCRANAWQSALFYKAEPRAVHFGLQDAVCEHEVQEQEVRGHMQFNQCGLVAYSKDSTSKLVFCRRGNETGVQGPVVGTIFGRLAPGSEYVIEAIAKTSPTDQNGLLAHPIGLTADCGAEEPQNDSKQQPEPKRRRMKIRLKEESDEDEIPKPRRAPSVVTGSTVIRNATGSQPMSEELSNLLCFEKELALIRSNSPRGGSTEGAL